MAAGAACSAPASPLLGAVRAVVCCSDKLREAQHSRRAQSDSYGPIHGRFGLAVTVAFGGAPGIATCEGISLREALLVWETGVLVLRRWFKCMTYIVHH